MKEWRWLRVRKLRRLRVRRWVWGSAVGLSPLQSESRVTDSGSGEAGFFPLLNGYSFLSAPLICKPTIITQCEVEVALGQKVEVAQCQVEAALGHYYIKITGTQNTTVNVHLLNHLPVCVKKWGPLWAYSCFHFENMNSISTFADIIYRKKQ